MRLEVNRLRGGYGKNIILHDISFSAQEGDIVYVLGANGCGKTTMFNMITGQKHRISGAVRIGGEDIETLSFAQRAKRIAYIPQTHVPAFNYNVRDVVLMGRAAHIRRFGVPSDADQRVAANAMDMLGIASLSESAYTKLSGGQQQLVLIARAVCQQAHIILMDEPLQSLDFVNQAMVTQTLKQLSAQGYTVILSTHTVINNYSPQAKALLMDKDGHAVYGEIEDVLEKSNIEKAYGIEMQTMTGEDEKGGKHIMCLPIQR